VPEGRCLRKHKASLASKRPCALAPWRALRYPPAFQNVSACQPVGTPPVMTIAVAYALAPAWAVSQACNTSADTRPRSLTLWPFFLAHSRIDLSVSRL
jgi:hypothetical protein